MKSLIIACVLTFLLSDLTLANQFLFESLMPYQKGSCIDSDRVVLMSNLVTKDFEIPVSLDGKNWQTVVLHAGERKVLITTQVVDNEKEKVGIVKQVIYVKVNSTVKLLGEQFYILDSNDNSFTIGRVPTICEDGRLMQAEQ